LAVNRVTADNRGNSTAVLGKLITLSDGTAHVVRMFYIPEKSRLKLEQLAPGRYEIYSQELDTGRIFKSAAFATTFIASDGLPRNQNWTVGLFPQLQGNSSRTEISETQFERGP
jgi:hypothetical protein